MSESESRNERSTHPTKIIFRQVEYLLWGARALDGGVGEGEDGVPSLEVLDGAIRLLYVRWGVVGADGRVAFQRFNETFYLRKPCICHNAMVWKQR